MFEYIFAIGVEEFERKSMEIIPSELCYDVKVCTFIIFALAISILVK